MKRKLIQLAGKTMVVSLPTKFVKKYNLKKSEEVEVVEDNGQIRIITKKEIAGKRSIEVEDSNLAKEQIDILYSCGFDQIRIKISDKESLKKIQQMIQLSNLDYELFITSNKSCVLQSIRDIDVEQFDNLLRRVFYMLCQEEKEQLIPHVERILSICNRILHKKGHKNHNSTLLMGNLLLIIQQLTQTHKEIPLIRDFYNLYYNHGDAKKIYKKISTIKDKGKTNLLHTLTDILHSLKMLDSEQTTDFNEICVAIP